MIELKSKSSKLILLPDRGLNCASWTVQDKEVFYVDPVSFNHHEVKYKGGNPPMFPIFSTLAMNGDSHLNYQGHGLYLAQHGFARLAQDWQILKQNKNSCTCMLIDSDVSLAIFPFPFELTIEFRLDDHRLTLRQSLRNPGNTPLPFVAGWHPYFKVSDPRHCRIEGLPLGVQYDYRPNRGDSLPRQLYDGHLPLGLEEVNHHFSSAPRELKLVDLDDKRDILIASTSVYRCVTCWSEPGEPFVCLEPVTGRRGALESGENLTLLAPGAEWHGQVVFSVLQRE